MSMLQEVPDLRDSYKRFFSKFNLSKEQFFNFGIRETIYAPIDKAQEGWDELKRRISNNDTVYIRGFGRDSIREPSLSRVLLSSFRQYECEDCPLEQ